jgi:uncharacterized protein (TIGR01777 family)
MSRDHFEARVELPVPAAEAFAWHERPGALARLTPPWERVVVESQSGGLRDGAKVRLRAKVGPFWVRWVVCHRDYQAGRLFRDVAERSPFASWDHRHEFTDLATGGSELRDRIEYALPGGLAGRLAGGAFTRAKLAAMFAYRQAVTREDLVFAREGAVGARAMRILISGASGLVGRALVPFLTTQGHDVVRLVRGQARGPDEVTWDPTGAGGELDLSGAGRIDAVVHLAGAGIADARWTEARRREIRDSRVKGTRLLAEALARMATPPAVVVGGSATGFYGATGEETVTEGAPPGAGFLAGVTQAWEEAWAPLAGRDTRLVFLRTGVVLSPAGGALAKLLPAFRLGLGGPVGNGRQWMSWISIDDLVGVIGHALRNDAVRGPMNAVAPEPVRSAEFATTLGAVLGRPAFLPAPAWALRLALGRGRADEALLASQRVQPGVLTATGYRFRHENVTAALRHVLGRVC